MRAAFAVYALLLLTWAVGACQLVDLLRSRDTPPNERGDRRPRPRDLGPVRWVPHPATLGGAPPAAAIDARPALPGAFTRLGELIDEAALAEARAVFEGVARAASASGVRPVTWSIAPRDWDVNASTRCTPRGAEVVVARGLVRLAAHLASVRALDERTGSRAFDGYADALAHLLRRRGVVVGPELPELPAPVANDPWKLARQRRLFADLMTFVAAHELGHVALGHGGCEGVDAGGHGGGDQHQRELAADAWAVDAARPWASNAGQGARVLLAFYGRWERIAEGAGVVPRRSHPRAEERARRIEGWNFNVSDGAACVVTSDAAEGASE